MQCSLNPENETIQPISLTYRCIATGKTLDQLRANMSRAIELHLKGMREDGLPIPEPTTLADYIEAA